MKDKLIGLSKKVIGSLRARPIISSASLIIGIGIVALIATSGGESPYDFVVVEKTDLVQEVNVTGQVKAVQNADLSFEQSGIIAQVLADVGDEVTIGQTLVTLRSNDTVALLNQAEAQVDAEVAALNELRESTSQDLESSYAEVLDVIDNALAKSEDAIRAKTAGLFYGSKYTYYYPAFDVCNAPYKNAASDLRQEAEFELDDWNKELGVLEESDPSREELDVALVDAKSHLRVIQDTVNAINDALSTKCAVENSTLDTARTNMAAAQVNIATVLSSVNGTIDEIALNKIYAANENDIAAQEARVRAAQASADNYRAQLEKTLIRSPINGVVTKQEASVGESVVANTPVVSVISSSNFEIEAFIPEADISKVKVGDTAKVTLDAYGRDVIFDARVSAIDLGETIIEGVTTYKTKFEFLEDDERIKSGMTANIDVLTAKKENIIAVPQRAVISDNGGKFVRVLTNQDEIVEISVQTGLRGSDGNIEITEGLNIGDKVVTFINEEG